MSAYKDLRAKLEIEHIRHTGTARRSPIYAEAIDAVVEEKVGEAFDALVGALEYAKEIIDDQAQRFHQECRCQLCESAPQTIDAALQKAGVR